eukprot:CAMPEP_0182855892 /NCGR_PEP_ID=MMETSP0034_2-20130328/2114_1 /TAXON_ID=156128 /ORGANISM="Nephroselmis pyriformis, Strain CCMP717" /LENGTH=146 /DNA_ID=CAMNT_0024986917 /DNA_START=145 /DNA_END=581 /DNA_ORIENTATION=-
MVGGEVHAQQQHIDAALLRVHTRFTSVLATLLSPKVRQILEFLSLMCAVALLATVAVFHFTYVGQPGCAAELFKDDLGEDFQIVNINVVGKWSEMFEKLAAKLDAEDRLLLEAEQARPGYDPEAPLRPLGTGQEEDVLPAWAGLPS